MLRALGSLCLPGGPRRASEVRCMSAPPLEQMAAAALPSPGVPGCTHHVNAAHRCPSPLLPAALPGGLQDSRERPLTMCLKHGDLELALLLLTKGADPRSISLMDGDTPLHAALHIFLDINGRPLVFSWSLP